MLLMYISLSSVRSPANCIITERLDRGYARTPRDKAIALGLWVMASLWIWVGLGVRVHVLDLT